MADVKYDATGQQIEPRDITHVGGVAQTGRDLSADLQVLTDLKKAGDNADGVAVETAYVLKALARLMGFNGTTWDRLITRDLDSYTMEALKGLVTYSQIIAKGDTSNQHFPVTSNQPINDAEALAANSHALRVSAYSMLFNGATMDRVRNNNEATVLASAARTATTLSADQTNYNARGVMLWFDITIVPGTDTVQLSIELKDPISGKYCSAYTFEAALAATGFRTYLVYPGHTAGQLNGSVNQAIPRTWRVRVTHVGSGSFTYSVGASYIL